MIIGGGRHLRPVPLASRPTVSVLVPCYNYGHFLPDAVGSVLDQHGVDVDVLIIDDASADGSAEIAVRLAEQDSRVKVICHQKNQGHIATYNEGLFALQGDYSVLLDADDMLTPGSLARSTALMEHNQSVGMVYGFPLSFAGEPPMPVTKVRNWTVWQGDEWIQRVCRRGTFCVMTPEVVMRTSLQRDIGGYDPELPVTGDNEMWLRAAGSAEIGRVNGASQAWYRVHDENMHLTTYSGLMVDITERHKAFASSLMGPKCALDNGEMLYRTACRAMAIEALAHADRFIHDSGDVDQAEQFVSFARAIYPDASGLRQWNRVSKSLAATAANRRPRRIASLRAGWSEVTNRVRWRRWRWSGV
ncbi:MAG: glycosyltransferase family A protein [Actinomycetes bacterium]